MVWAPDVARKRFLRADRMCLTRFSRREYDLAHRVHVCAGLTACASMPDKKKSGSRTVSLGYKVMEKWRLVEVEGMCGVKGT